jgi:hypothetical protein
MLTSDAFVGINELRLAAPTVKIFLAVPLVEIIS